MLDLSPTKNDFHAQLDKIVAVAKISDYASSGLIDSSDATIKSSISHFDRTTSTLVNSMSVIIIASSFESFTREAINLTAQNISGNFSSISEEVKCRMKNSYTSLFYDAKIPKNLYSDTNKNALDSIKVRGVTSILSSISKLLASNDTSDVDHSVFLHHRNNFKPDVVDQIARRIGLEGLIKKSASHTAVKTFFGVTLAKDAAPKLTAELNSFYDLRNETVHSLNATSGPGITQIDRFADLFKVTSTGMCKALEDFNPLATT